MYRAVKRITWYDAFLPQHVQPDAQGRVSNPLCSDRLELCRSRSWTSAGNELPAASGSYDGAIDRQMWLLIICSSFGEKRGKHQVAKKKRKKGFWLPKMH